jgi:SH3-like domain-containing protein
MSRSFLCLTAVLLAATVLNGPAPAQTTPPPSALGHSSALGDTTKPPPVVQAPHDTHAEKLTPAAKHTAGKHSPSERAPSPPATAAKPAPSKPSAAKPGAAKTAPAKPAAPAAVPATAPAAEGPPAPGATPPEPPKGTVTNLPLPRWASLRTDEVNLRAGPGTRYPIDWVYKRRDLPVQIEREFEVWRLVEDQDGIKGWVHQATLVGRRSFIVTGAERSLRGEASDDAAVVAILKPGVIGRIRACAAGAAWCEVQVGDYRGWLKRADFWGTYPGEAVQ